MKCNNCLSYLVEIMPLPRWGSRRDLLVKRRGNGGGGGGFGQPRVGVEAESAGRERGGRRGGERIEA